MTSMHRRSCRFSDLQGRVVSSFLTRIQFALGILFWHIANVSGLMSVLIISQPKSASSLDHLPPSHPISSAIPGFLAKSLPFKITRFSTSVM